MEIPVLELGRLIAGAYQAGADGRPYGDLTVAERIDVIQKYYGELHRAASARRHELELEADLVAAMPVLADRAAYMNAARAERAIEFPLLALLVRAAFARRTTSGS